MLPDFPKTKSEISRLMSARVRNKMKEMSPFASLPRSFTQHEGDVNSYPQEGTGTVTEGFEHFEVPVTVNVAELRTLVGDRLLEKIDVVAEELARKTSEHGYRVMDEAVEKAGTHLDANGQPFSRELFLEMIQKMDMTFDSSGKPEFVLIMHPDMAKALSKVSPAWDEDAEFKRKYEEILAQKKEAWLDRESYRKLVD